MWSDTLIILQRIQNSLNDFNRNEQTYSMMTGINIALSSLNKLSLTFDPCQKLK